MTDYRDHFDRAARLAILAELARQADATLNALLIGQMLDAFGPRKPAAWVETQLMRLADLGAVRLRTADLPGLGEVTVASLTRAGRDHVERRALLAGVAPPADTD